MQVEFNFKDVEVKDGEIVLIGETGEVIVKSDKYNTEELLLEMIGELMAKYFYELNKTRTVDLSMSVFKKKIEDELQGINDDFYIEVWK